MDVWQDVCEPPNVNPNTKALLACWRPVSLLNISMKANYLLIPLTYERMSQEFRD